MHARPFLRLIACAALAACASVPALAPAAPGASAADAPLPLHLRDTGLYADDTFTGVGADNLPFAPQYPLWSDGATKRRWIHLPPGTAIDASQPDAWTFPPGTRLWKEFSVGRRVETRLIERLADGSWRFAAYVWNDDGTDAVLAPAEGVDVDVAGAPDGRYTVPSRTDCLACHEGGNVPVLGFTALQLSPDRDPLAPHAEPALAADVDLRALAARGLIRGLPPTLLEQPPRIAATTPIARAALGYLHGNCGHCHNDVGALADLDFTLAQSTSARAPTRTLQSLLQASHFRPRGTGAVQRVAPGHPESSVVAVRMQATNPVVRMPPLGVQRIDTEALALIQQWIRNDVHDPQEATP